MKRWFARRSLGTGALQTALRLGAITCAAASAAAPLPPSDPWTELPIATLATKPATALQMGKIKVWLEFNTLAEVMRVAGINRISRHEDDKDSYDWICYDVDAHRQRLWFVSDTDTGGEQRMVTSIVAATVAAPADENACPLLPKVLGSIALDRTIWLGTSDDDLARKLGEPSSVRREWRSFYSVHRVLAPRKKLPGERTTKYDDVDESSYLNVHLVDGRIVELVAGKLTGE